MRAMQQSVNMKRLDMKYHNITAARPVRFFITGGSAAALEYMSFMGLVYFTGAQVGAAHTISFLCGVAISYIGNKYWVFASKKYSHREVIQFAVLVAVNIVLSNLLIYGLTDMLYLQEGLAKLIVMAAVAVWNYLVFQRIIFKQTSHRAL